jgi:polyisoprenoid-binding protein YceI
VNHRVLLVLIAALAATFTLGACADNPADSVPAAQVSDTESGESGESSAEQPADESMADESMADEGEGESAVEGGAGDDAPADDSGAAQAGKVIPLEGTIAALGSKVTGSHYLLFQEWTGELDTGEGTPETATIAFEVQTASVISDPESRGAMSERLDNHLFSDDFFAVEEYPTATFVSTSIVEGGEGDATHTVTGDLTLRDITKEITFPATVTVGDDKVTATAEFSVNRMDFDIAYPGSPDDLIREEVVLQIDVEGML